MNCDLTTRLGERGRRPRRIFAAASTVALVAGLVASGTAHATFILGGTWGAYDEAGNELNVATRDIFGSDGSSIWTGSEGSKHHFPSDGPDEVADEGPKLDEFFVGGDLACSPQSPVYVYSNDDFNNDCAGPGHSMRLLNAWAVGRSVPDHRQGSRRHRPRVRPLADQRVT